MKDISLYIHIPFCKSKCWYCDFPSFCGKDNLMDSYIKALGKEIDAKVLQYNIKTIFIGGGTPTYLPLKMLEDLKAHIKKLNLTPNVEFTVECNPGTLDKEKLELLKDMGVNRLSIGLQAYDDSLLKEIGRIHNVDEFLKNYELARSIGFENINIDLMFALPNQTSELWKESLIKVAKLNPEHISAYSLILEEDTRFYDLNNKGTLNLPEEDVERGMYESLLSILKDFGYNQYEISNFSKEGRECRHNMVYWSMDEYIGVGSSSASYIESIRYKNVESVEEYIQKINTDKQAYKEKYKNLIKEDVEEFMFMGLRKTKGIEEKEFLNRFGKDIDSYYKDIINKYINVKLLKREDGYLKFTAEGIQLSNYVLADFLID
ncbi:radical SAM family heme chaperone HemW [Clostridium algidicarnis]|uniref:Heme chaperone HemW n=2 Tax=Clostridium algidicarnis TaxID=37659 RepID=A0A2S6G166_9CLOT|nr:radical SAM family heme chaperone HemW [Clostridium algidicarnis]MBB6630491.1 oxygen-independent coproporphyrinogen III oxidase [Clostridium algidicarnis]MBU3193591.1 radical SAM family heme chaperone HemW [Clostridium algidicarnis]MBU3203003.1 radical SAM family heme chaperone HemW [Clostridium algidicarnis]MBU3205698.1 radical SAM family heme chaperone HemW [Clostridium algidicarnis]MBU3211157.1 radical SAM family heme chaperone HemW [Clostridium algidicarnis]